MPCENVPGCLEKALENEMLSNLFNEYSEFLQAEKGAAEATRKSYLTAVEAFFTLLQRHPGQLFLPEDWELAQLDKRALETYLNHLRDGRGWAPASIALQASALRNFFNFLVGRGYLERNPARNLLPKLPDRSEEPPAGEESAIVRLIERQGRTLTDARCQLLLELLYGGALRPSQVYAVKSLRVAKRAGLARIALKGEKAGGKEAGGETLEVRLSPGGLSRAEKYLSLRKAALGGKRNAPFWITESGRAVPQARLSRQVKREMERVGLPGGPSVLRRLAARHFRERGGGTQAVRDLLRAKRLGSLDKYASPDFQSVARRVRQIHPRQQDPGALAEPEKAEEEDPS